MRADLDAAHEVYHNSYLQYQEDSDAAESQYHKELEAINKERERNHEEYLKVWRAQNRDRRSPELVAAHEAYEIACVDTAARKRESWRRYWDAQHKIDDTLTEAHDRYLEVWSRERQPA